MRTINREQIISDAGHVLVLKGGQSSEREISLISGQAVFEGMQRLGINASVLDVGDDVIEQFQRIKPDFVFNMLHGKGGEDGVIQGVLETMKIPYSGSGVLASALAMDKIRSKLIWQQLGLGTADFEMLRPDSDFERIIEKFGTVVVKPVNGGSSIGISIVSDPDVLREEFANAQAYDSEVMAEAYVAGKEFSVGILGEQSLPAIQLSTKRAFFDFEAKYIDEDTQVTCPPDLSQEDQDRLNELVRGAYSSLGCQGLARVDVMQDKAGNFYVLEVNTVPGMTSHSFVPLAAKEAGIGFDELLLRILDEGLDKGSITA